MNQRQEETINLITKLAQDITAKTEINEIDELRLILITKHIEDCQDLLNQFGSKTFQRVKC